ncbi:MAG: hypothetical protein HQ526_11790, partial [Actinobacteria bacterium]|nr:hypothetical protein [Actinomycetota bacterium]
MTDSSSTLTLLVGSEDFLVERAITQIVRSARRIDPDTERRDVDGIAPGALGSLEQACSPTLFGGGAIVVVDNAESADPALIASIARAAREEGGVELIALHQGGARGKKNLEALTKVARDRISCDEVKRGRAIAEFVNSEMRSLKRTMTPQGQALLIAAVGTDIRALAAACSQLASDVQQNEIDADAIGKYFGGTVDVTGFQIADAVLNRQAGQALRLLRLAEGTDGGSRLGPATVASLVNAIRQLVAVSGADPGTSDRDLAALAKIPPWKLRTINQQLRRWSQLDLAEAVLLLGDLDAAMKGGLREGDQLEPTQKGLAMEEA